MQTGNTHIKAGIDSAAGALIASLAIAIANGLIAWTDFVTVIAQSIIVGIIYALSSVSVASMRRRLEARRHADVDRYARGKQPAIRITATGANDSIAALDAAQRQLRELAKPIKREVKK